MPFLRSRRLLVGVALLVLASAAFWYARLPALAPENGDALVARVRQGDFRVVVTTTGELRARKFVQIQGPANAQQAELWNGMRVSTLVPEGTLVAAGDVVAELDRGPAATKASEFQLALQKAEAQYTQALRGYWTAYYRLRRLTLYDFEDGRPIL